MIIFDLACQQGDQFEGWFQSREDFDRQLANGLIACPHCGSLEIRRVPSAVHLAGAASAAAAAPPAVGRRASAFAAFRQLTERLLASCEDVGSDFASEARRIHYVEAPERSIRGDTSAEEYQALLDEGIEVFRLARLKPGNLH
ncbi:MAG: DUF1178 family protein [Candidatus Accumulibacter sp. UW26]|jgi:hypothetical protein